MLTHSLNCSDCTSRPDMQVAAVIDGTKSTWNYSSSLWTDQTMFEGVTEARSGSAWVERSRLTVSAPSSSQRKTNAWFMPFTAIRIQFQVGNVTNCLWLNVSDTSLAALFSRGAAPNASGCRLV